MMDFFYNRMVKGVDQQMKTMIQWFTMEIWTMESLPLPFELVKNKLKRVNHVNHVDLVEKEMCGIYREK